MKAEIISIGTELLLGDITDTNSAYLAGQLPLLGLDLNYISTVGDNQGRLIETLKQAWQRSDIIITTGGLGPTQDDITREAIAEFLGENLAVDYALVEKFEELFRYFKREMPPSNIKQATVIPSAEIVPNPRGTAPGWWVENDNRIIVTLPGPPREMELMWTKEMVPRLQQMSSGAVIVSKTLKTFGLTEAEVDEKASPFLPSTNPTVGTYAKIDGVYLRITAKAESEAKAQKLISQKRERYPGYLERIYLGYRLRKFGTYRGENAFIQKIDSSYYGVLYRGLFSQRHYECSGQLQILCWRADWLQRCIKDSPRPRFAMHFPIWDCQRGNMPGDGNPSQRKVRNIHWSRPYRSHGTR